MIDSHAHIDFPEFNRDREEVLARARQQGVDTIITVGTDLASSRFSLQIAREHADVYTTVGFHPHNASQLEEDGLRQLADIAAEEKVVAIGEIGLDFYRNTSPGPQQLEAFRQQLDLAKEVELPVVIHSRQAHRETLEILTDWSASFPAKSRRLLGVLHCFSGDVSLADRYIRMGFMISIPGSVTYPSAQDKVEVARWIPLDRLLVETDSPFLPPQRYRGRRNEPAYIPLIVDRIAQIKGLPMETVARATAENAISVFRLPGG